MILPQLELKVANKRLIEFFNLVGVNSGVLKEDINSLLNYEEKPLLQIKPNKITIKIEEGRPVNFELSRPIIEVIGQNQIGKTTVLLYLANLLGYDFFDENNIRFLNDEKIVAQGKEIFSKLVAGMNTRVDIEASPYLLSVTTDKGELVFDIMKGNELIVHKSRLLNIMSDVFMNEIKEYIDVQFISKGRRFDKQLIIDISNEMLFYIENLYSRAKLLMNHLNSKMNELSKTRAIEQSIDLESRKKTIKNELKEIIEEQKMISDELLTKNAKLDRVNNILAQLVKLDEMSYFQIRRDFYQKSFNLQRLKDRLRILLASKENFDRIKLLISEKTTKDTKIDEELERKREVYNKIINEFEKTLLNMESNLGEFLNSDMSYQFMQLIITYEIDDLIEVRRRASTEAKESIQELYSFIIQYNPAIRLPDDLGGSIGALQQKINRSRTTILDENLLAEYTHSLFNLLEEHEINSSMFLSNLKIRIDELERIKSETLEEISFLEKQLDEISLEHDSDMYNRTQKQIEQLEDLINGLRIKFEKFSEDEIQPLLLAEKQADSIEPDDPMALLYSEDSTDRLLSLRAKLNSEITSCGKNQNENKKKINDLQLELENIKEFLYSTELQRLNERIDGIDTFMGLLSNIEILMRNSQNLRNKDRIQKYIKVLWNYNLEKHFYDTINDIFNERCQNYYQMIDLSNFDKLKINRFDYFDKWFEYDEIRKNINALSGATASVMTVLSLASKRTMSEFGIVLLVDEFQDVAETLRNETHKSLLEEENLSFAFFVRPRDKLPLTAESIDLGV